MLRAASRSFLSPPLTHGRAENALGLLLSEPLSSSFPLTVLIGMRAVHVFSLRLFSVGPKAAFWVKPNTLVGPKSSSPFLLFLSVVVRVPYYTPDRISPPSLPLSPYNPVATTGESSKHETGGRMDGSTVYTNSSEGLGAWGTFQLQIATLSHGCLNA